jgi:hypothetical protein
MAVVNSVDADLRPFKARSGKLLAKWNGRGSTDDAANFVCVMAPQAK